MKYLAFILLFTPIAHATSECEGLYETTALSREQYAILQNPNSTPREILQVPNGFTSLDIDRRRNVLSKQLLVSQNPGSHTLTLREAIIDKNEESQFRRRMSEATSELRRELHSSEILLTGWLTDGVDREGLPSLSRSKYVSPELTEGRARGILSMAQTVTDFGLQWFGDKPLLRGLKHLVSQREARQVIEVQSALLKDLTQTLNVGLAQGQWLAQPSVDVSSYFHQWAQQHYDSAFLFESAGALSPFADVQLVFILNVVMYGSLNELNAQNAPQLRLQLEKLIAESLYVLPSAYEDLPRELLLMLDKGLVGFTNISRFFKDEQLAQHLMEHSVLALDPKGFSDFVRIILKLEDMNLLRRFSGRYVDGYLLQRFDTLSAFYNSSKWRQPARTEQNLTQLVLMKLTEMRPDISQGFAGSLHAIVHPVPPDTSASTPSRSQPQQTSLPKSGPRLIEGPKP